MTSVLLIDDNESQHELFRCYVMNCDNIELGHAKNMDEAVDQLSQRDWDVVMLDNRMHPFQDYRQTMPLLQKQRVKGKVVIISSDVNEPLFAESFLDRFNIKAAYDKSEFDLSNFEQKIETMS